MKKYISIALLILCFAFVSCESKTVTKMDAFLEGKVEKVIMSDNIYILTLRTKSDSLVIANIDKDFIEPKKDFKIVKVGDELKIKGEKWCFTHKQELDCLIQVINLK